MKSNLAPATRAIAQLRQMLMNSFILISIILGLILVISIGTIIVVVGSVVIIAIVGATLGSIWLHMPYANHRDDSKRSLHMKPLD